MRAEFSSMVRYWNVGHSSGRCASCRKNARHSNTDRKSTRLNSSHSQISYAVFCLKKKKYTPWIVCLPMHALRATTSLPRSARPAFSWFAGPAFSAAAPALNAEQAATPTRSRTRACESVQRIERCVCGVVATGDMLGARSRRLEILAERVVVAQMSTSKVSEMAPYRDAQI